MIYLACHLSEKWSSRSILPQGYTLFLMPPCRNGTERATRIKDIDRRTIKEGIHPTQCITMGNAGAFYQKE